MLLMVTTSVRFIFTLSLIMNRITVCHDFMMDFVAPNSNPALLSMTESMQSCLFMHAQWCEGKIIYFESYFSLFSRVTIAAGIYQCEYYADELDFQNEPVPACEDVTCPVRTNCSSRFVRKLQIRNDGTKCHVVAISSTCCLRTF